MDKRTADRSQQISLSGNVLAIGTINSTNCPDALIAAFGQPRPLNTDGRRQSTYADPISVKDDDISFGKYP
ncbi:hypothetical protein BMW22_28480 (plasmid) [Rhizobium leguminosarum]|uniref:Uncharacterized protein n=1 Tax=Rhizobium leguminosarum TaxID=384 RepID=A0A1L3ZIH7_RHILE|nr:hypothetical protein BMW22_28480 [Rhizobium leguminosarum]